MKQYRIYFLSGESLLLTRAEYLIVMDGYTNAPTDALIGFTNDDKTIWISKQNITHILSEHTTETKSAVVTPPSPAELRAEKEREESTRDITLDAQLSQGE